MMTEELLSGKDNFQELLSGLYSAFDHDNLKKIRAKAWDHFLELGLPTKKEEVFRYLKLRTLYSKTYRSAQRRVLNQNEIDPYILPECQTSLLVFVNGFFAPELSNYSGLSSKVAISTLSTAAHTFSTFLNNQWAKGIKEETDPFAVLNAALHQDGVFVYLPPNTIAGKPIQVLSIVDADNESMLILPRIHVFAGAHSEVSFISTQGLCSGQHHFVNTVFDFAVEEGAKVEYIQSVQHESDDAWHFDATRATLKRNSVFKTIAATNGSGTVRFDYRVVLAGENSEALLNGISMLKGKKEAHTHVLIEHQAPHCHSMQLFKCALNEFGRSSFEGKILVRQAAQKTDAFQLNNNLLLSDRANADSKPNLEIFADDVKASHGATFGQLDQEQIFYMKTRGFSDAEAKNLLVEGYCQEVINQVSIPVLHEEWKQISKGLVSHGD